MPLEPITASISALASILSIAVSVRTLATDNNLKLPDALKLYISRAKGPERDILNKTGIQESILEITVISSALLDQLADEAKKCEERHIKLRKQAEKDESQMDKDLADTKAAGCMCNVLRAIMKHNKGKLPQNGPFESWWVSYQCSK